MLRLLCAFLLVVLGAAVSHAHDPQLSSLKIIHQNRGGTIVSVGTHLTQLQASDPDAAIRTRLKLRLDGRVFTPAHSLLMRDTANNMVTWQAPYAGPATTIAVESRLYPEDANSRFIVAEIDQGTITRQAVLDEAHPSATFSKDAPLTETERHSKPAPSAFWSVAGVFLLQGIQHILGGLDHICFVLGLLLLGGSVKQLLKTITAFTLAHSITLTLAALGIWSPSPRIVEPLIALSIVAIAVENVHCLQRKPTAKATRETRPYFAFGFGLIHGFGFAGALREVGLPPEAMAPALASFNVGVELGQAAIVLCVAPLLALLSQKVKPTYRLVVLYGPFAIATAGLCWFIQRLFNIG